MYQKGYGIIETQAPLHVGASAGEETGNLNLIFRDQFTLTGIIPGSSIRGRFRADMREEEGNFEYWYGRDSRTKKLETTAEEPENVSNSQNSEGTTEGIVKFEYASVLWLPVYCPSQPIVRVSCPSLLKRYQKLANLSRHNSKHKFQPYSYYQPPQAEKPKHDRLFFNLGFLPLKSEDSTLKDYLPDEIGDAEDYLLLVIKDTEMATIHDMALYRQSRVALKDNEKIVDGKGFFNVEALPEKTVLVFPLALKKEKPDPWQEFIQAAKMTEEKELYFGGLESVGFGRTKVILKETPEPQGTESEKGKAKTEKVAEN